MSLIHQPAPLNLQWHRIDNSISCPTGSYEDVFYMISISFRSLCHKSKTVLKINNLSSRNYYVPGCPAHISAWLWPRWSVSDGKPSLIQTTTQIPFDSVKSVSISSWKTQILLFFQCQLRHVLWHEAKWRKEMGGPSSLYIIKPFISSEF
jgi:hypothetical protein